MLKNSLVRETESKKHKRSYELQWCRGPPFHRNFRGLLLSPGAGIYLFLSFPIGSINVIISDDWLSQDGHDIWTDRTEYNMFRSVHGDDNLCEIYYWYKFQCLGSSFHHWDSGEAEDSGEGGHWLGFEAIPTMSTVPADVSRPRTLWVVWSSAKQKGIGYQNRRRRESTWHMTEGKAEAGRYRLWV